MPRLAPMALRQQGKTQMSWRQLGDASPHTGVLCLTASWDNPVTRHPSTNPCKHSEPFQPHTGPLLLLQVLTCVTGHSRPLPCGRNTHFNCQVLVYDTGVIASLPGLAPCVPQRCRDQGYVSVGEKPAILACGHLEAPTSFPAGKRGTRNE